MGKLFDNVMKTIRAVSTFVTATLVSLEIDFELPRGYIAKIHDVVLEAKNVQADLLAIDTDAEWGMQIALIRDPDDITSIEEPNNTVDHDVICAMESGVHFNPVATVGTALITKPLRVEWNFSAEGLDVFSARNMRLNIDGIGAQVANLTEATGEAVVRYTLERIRDDDIINLLDIL